MWVEFVQRSSSEKVLKANLSYASFVRGVVDENMVDLFCKMMTLIRKRMCAVIV